MTLGTLVVLSRSRFKGLILSGLLGLSIFTSLAIPIAALATPARIGELMTDNTKELYIDSISASVNTDTKEKTLNINLVCKNLRAEPHLCVDTFFFSLVDSSDGHYQPKLFESTVMPARIATRDTMRGTLTFVIPSNENATRLIYNEPRSSTFEIDLLSTKNPTDEPPTSEWNLSRNRGLTLSDPRLELKIYNETQTNEYYVLDISIRNIGTGIVNYNPLYAYIKDDTGLVFASAFDAEIEQKLGSGILQLGSQVRGKVAFKVGNGQGPFMFIYDDISGSYFATGKFVPLVSSEVKAEIVGADDLVAISEHNAYVEPVTRTYRIIGEVVNNSNQFATDIQVHAIVRDRDSNTLAQTDHILRNFLSSASSMLAPNARIPFILEFNIAENAIENIGSYQLSLHHVFSDAKATALQVSSADLVQVSKPTPFSKYVLWHIDGELVNLGDVRSTHTQIMVSVYDSENSLIGVGGFSSLDQQPSELNPGQKKQFSIEITVPVILKPSSFYLYAQSDQFVIKEPKTYGSPENQEPENSKSPLPEPKNSTSVRIFSKQRNNLMQIVVKTMPNDTAKIYGIEIYPEETGIHVLKAKLRWESKELTSNDVLLSTINNPIRQDQKAKFLFNVNSDVNLFRWKVLDHDGTILLEGETKPVQLKH